MTNSTKNKFAEILAEQQAKAANIQNTSFNAPKEEVKPEPAPEQHKEEVKPIFNYRSTFDLSALQEKIKEEPKEKTGLNLSSIRILWHEGAQEPSYNNATFTTWAEAQKAFFHIWEVNEKDNEFEGYTKTKIEIIFEGNDPLIDRVDLTKKVNSGDFNPSQETLFSYLQKRYCEPHEFFTPDQEATQTEIQSNSTGPKNNDEEIVLSPAETAMIDNLLIEIFAPAKEETPAIQQPEQKKIKLEIVSYSDKSFAVIGDTYDVHEKLNQLGGTFNRFLKCGKGYIFSNKRLETVQKFISSIN